MINLYSAEAQKVSTATTTATLSAFEQPTNQG